MYRYDDSEGSPNRDGVSMFLAYRSMPFTDRYDDFFLYEVVPVLNLVVLPFLFACKTKPYSVIFASGGAFSGILRRPPAAPSAGSSGGASGGPSGGAPSGASSAACLIFWLASLA